VFWGQKCQTTNSVATTFSYTRIKKGVPGPPLESPIELYILK
jgi:hypothetical protein